MHRRRDVAQSTIRIGIVGAGGIVRQRHIPGLRKIPDVAIVAVCNSTPESTARAAQELGISRATLINKIKRYSINA
ncbi:MAG: hypothetical protein C4289_04790 [Chloroflexota bacterium]